MPATIQQLMKDAATALGRAFKNPDQGWSEAELLVASVMNKDRAWVVAHGDEAVRGAKKTLVESLVKRRLKREPLAYLIGHWNFYGREFLTDKRALIPRPETEELVQRALEILASVPAAFLVWDVGVGCGAIATTIKAESPLTAVVASDVSRPALALARKNHARLTTRLPVTFVHADLLDQAMTAFLQKNSAPSRLITANLPYLPLADKRRLSKDVVAFEPSQALFTKDNGNYLIHKLLSQLAKFHAADGRPLTILAECDPPQAKTLKKIAARIFPHAAITIHVDFCGRDRFLEIQT